MVRTAIREATGFPCMIYSILETASKRMKIKGKIFTGRLGDRRFHTVFHTAQREKSGILDFIAGPGRAADPVLGIDSKTKIANMYHKWRTFCHDRLPPGKPFNGRASSYCSDAATGIHQGKNEDILTGSGLISIKWTH
jgi:hypothetical protein